MKKVICLLTVFSLILCICACGKNGTNSTVSSNHSVDVAYYASLGKIPELDFALGADPDDILNAKDDNEESSDSGDHSHTPDSIRQEGNLSVMLDAGATRYYYEKSKAEKGISAIVCLNGAYGFLKDSGVTITSEQIKAAIPSAECEEKTPTADDLFFLPDTSDNAKVLIYVFNNKYKLQFFFVDGVFSAVMLSDMENWTI